MGRMDEIETNLTESSVSGARAVCDSLSSNRALSQEQRAAMMYAEAILDAVASQLDEQNAERWSDSDSGPHEIPIPPEALTADSAETVVEWAHGQANCGDGS